MTSLLWTCQTSMLTLLSVCPRLLGPAQHVCVSSSSSLPPCAARSLDLPEVVVDGQGVHADRHRLGRDDVELLAVRAVLVEPVNHLPADGARPRAGKLDDLLGFRCVRVNGAELAPAVTEEDDQVVGLALFQLL